MDTEIRNIKNILLVEDDPRDVELTLAALEEHNLANKVLVVQRRRGGAGLSLSPRKIHGAHGRQSRRRAAGYQDAEGERTGSVEDHQGGREFEDHTRGRAVLLAGNAGLGGVLQTRGQCLRGEAGGFRGIHEGGEAARHFLGGHQRTAAGRGDGNPDAMTSPLRILHLEDNANDAQLVERTLTAGGVACSITHAATRAEYLAALEDPEIVLALCDNTLPGFDGLSALRISRERRPELPFIFVTGTLGEEQAIESMQNGATDYVLKDRLTRLCPAVRRAMREIEGRAARKRAEEQFVQAQKMEVVGKLAAGVAHDFNNILSVIMGYCDLTMDKLGADAAQRTHLETIRAAGERRRV